MLFILYQLHTGIVVLAKTHEKSDKKTKGKTSWSSGHGKYTDVFEEKVWLLLSNHEHTGQ